MNLQMQVMQRETKLIQWWSRPHPSNLFSCVRTKRRSGKACCSINYTNKTHAAAKLFVLFNVLVTFFYLYDKTLWPKLHAEVRAYGSRHIRVHWSRNHGWRQETAGTAESSSATHGKQRQHTGNHVQLWKLKACTQWPASSSKATLLKPPKKDYQLGTK